MAEVILNNDVYETIADVTYLKPLTNKLPSKLKEDIQLVLDANPNTQRVQDIIIGANASATLLTTSTSKDTYITAITLNNASTAQSNDNVTFTTVDGVSHEFRCYGFVGTTDTNYISFAGKGMKLKRGTGIVFTGGTASPHIFLVGYTQDTNIYQMGETQ